MVPYLCTGLGQWVGERCFLKEHILDFELAGTVSMSSRIQYAEEIRRPYIP